MSNAPTPISEVMPTVLRSQLATCSCGAQFVQTKWLNLWVPDVCPKCAREEDRREHPAPISPEQERERLLAQLGVPPEYRDATIESLTDYGLRMDRERIAKLRTLAKAWLGDFAKRTCAPLLIFRGRWGTGKTHVAWAIARELVKAHGASVHVTKLAEMVRSIRAAWSDGGDAEDRVLERLRGYDLLVIDEASSHAMYGIENVRQHLYDVLDHRLIWQRPTIVTTNETIADFQANVFGPALVSRAWGAGQVWEFGDESATDFRAWRGQRRRDLE